MPTDSVTGQDGLLAGRYRLGRVLGSGGGGVVREGEDTLLRRRVAIKEVRLPPQATQAERDVLGERVLREARSAARLHHPGLVAVYDVIDADEHPWIVMEYVDGTSLSEVVRESGRVTPLRTAQLGIGLAYALEAAHKAGVVHRDVKPGNVLVTSDGRARLTDFGIAVTEGDPTLTASGMLVGSPAYIAPERARGAGSGAPADVWGLGATLFAAVEGEPPYAGEGPIATLTAVVEDRRRPFQHAGVLGGLLAELLDSDPARRPSLAEVRRRLRELVVRLEASGPDGRTEPAVPGSELGLDVLTGDGTPSGPASGRRSRKVPAVLGAVALFAAVAVALGVVVAGGEDRAGSSAGPASPGPAATSAAADATTETTAPSASTLPSTPPAAGSSAAPVAPADSSGGGGSADSDLGALVPSTTAPVAAPDGFTSHQDGSGWSVSVPADWKVGDRGNGRVSFTAAPGYPDLLVEVQAKAGPSALDAWRSLEPAVRDSSPDYRLVSMRAADGGDGTDAAVWEFTFSSGGETIHVLDLGVVRNGHGYALRWRVPEDQWQDQHDLMRTIFATLRPGP